MLPAIYKVPFWLFSIGFVVVAATAAYVIIRRSQSFGAITEPRIKEIQQPFNAKVLSLANSIIYDDEMKPAFRSRPKQIFGVLYETIIKADDSQLHRFIGAGNKYYFIEGQHSKLIAA